MTATPDLFGVPIRTRGLSAVLRRVVPAKTAYALAGAAIFVGIWAAASGLYFEPYILPSPWAVVQRMWHLLSAGVVWPNFASSLQKTLMGWGAALVLGIPMGLLMGRFRFARAFFHDFVYLLANVPLIVYGVLSLIFFGISDTGPAFVVLLLVLPAVAINVAAGVASAESGLLAMSRAFRRGNLRVTANVIMPAVLPFLLAGGRVSFADSWKLEALTETFGGSSGVGYQLRKAFQLFSIVDALAWMMFFVIFVLVIEHVVLARLERRIYSWRNPVGGGEQR